VAIDWRKELNLWKRIYFWYMKTGLIAIPFGIIYGFMVRYHHESMPVLVIILAAAVITNYKIQGMPPDK
jgi:hypothetical protein